MIYNTKNGFLGEMFAQVLLNGTANQPHGNTNGAWDMDALNNMPIEVKTVKHRDGTRYGKLKICVYNHLKLLEMGGLYFIFVYDDPKAPETKIRYYLIKSGEVDRFISYNQELCQRSWYKIVSNTNPLLRGVM
jgi:hypothetical protein